MTGEENSHILGEQVSYILRLRRGGRGILKYSVEIFLLATAAIVSRGQIDNRNQPRFLFGKVSTPRQP